MDKEKTTVEWLVAEDDVAWERMQEERAQGQPAVEKSSFNRRRLWRWLYGVLAAFVLLLLVGGWLWHKSEAGISQIEGEISVVAGGELPTATNNQDRLIEGFPATQVTSQLTADPPAMQKLIPQNPNGGLSVVHVELLNLQGDQAVVKLTLTDPASATTYRQTRFYRNTSIGWLQSRPDVALWGWESSLETAHFVFHYRQFDAAAVSEVAAQVDLLDDLLRADYNLRNDSATEKTALEISVNRVPGAFPTYPTVADPIVLASPALYLAPTELSDATILKQALFLRLLQQLSLQVSAQYHVPKDWQPLLAGLSLWQSWDAAMPLSIWREPVLRWLYASQPLTPQAGVPTLPQNADFCAAHHLWLATPVQIGIPVTCAEVNRPNTKPILRGLDEATPSHLAELTAPHLERRAHPGETVAMSTLIDYLVMTYGRRQLPLLLAKLSHYDRWETLLPAVYGAPAAEIEAGWRAYLTSHYGIELK